MKQLFKKLIEENPLEPTVKIVYKCLYKEIISLHLLPGSKINLSKISEELDVSRTTVRDAAILLSTNTKLVKMQSNQGFFVSNIDLVEMDNICTCRTIIETGAARILCEKITSEQIKFFYDLANNMNICVHENKLKEYANIDILFHKSIIDFCENKFVSKMYYKISDLISRYIFYTVYFKNINDFAPLLRHHNIIVHSLENSLINDVDLAIRKHCSDSQKFLAQSDSFLLYSAINGN